jgi:hypothetical protein
MGTKNGTLARRAARDSALLTGRQLGRPGAPRRAKIVWKSLESHMDAAGIDRAELAERVGTVYWTIYAWLTGRRFPNRDHIHACASALSGGDAEAMREIHAELLETAPRRGGRARI